MITKINAIMSFAGSVSAMIYSLKHNNALLRKKSLFRDHKEYLLNETNKRIYSKFHDNQTRQRDKEEVRKIIAQIKNEMRARNRMIRRNRRILLSIIVALLIVLTIYISQLQMG